MVERLRAVARAVSTMPWDKLTAVDGHEELGLALDALLPGDLGAASDTARCRHCGQPGHDDTGLYPGPLCRSSG